MDCCNNVCDLIFIIIAKKENIHNNIRRRAREVDRDSGGGGRKQRLTVLCRNLLFVSDITFLLKLSDERLSLIKDLMFPALL